MPLSNCSDEIYKQYIEMAAGSSVQNLNKQKVRNLIIPILDKEEQNSIAKILSDMEKTQNSNNDYKLVTIETIHYQKVFRQPFFSFV